MKVINGLSLKPNHKYFLECAKIHSKEIPGGFLPTLGLDFLSSLYEVFSKSKYSFLLLAIEDGRVVGFIAISLHTKEFFRQYLKTKIFKNLHQIPIVTFGKIFFIKSLEVFKYLFSNKTSSETFISNSEVFNFCVDGCVQGKGVGQFLFLNAVDRLRMKRIKTLKIVTGQSQIDAQKFYYKSGAILSHKIIVHDDEESVVFKYQING
jgi:ribosomal protein S18 acetylase RimI-like enzyme